MSIKKSWNLVPGGVVCLQASVFCCILKFKMKKRRFYEQNLFNATWNFADKEKNRGPEVD